MSTALTTAPAVTSDQLALVQKTVASGATADELKLYLYDCARQGVHPLDKLIHFTKRGGKYTPITSIDFMRTRAADSGEYAGNDDATFAMDAERLGAATVTVYRMVQGTRCPFTATARWAEDYPGDAGGTMWRKMPHTMLAKCAEALALRKGFPRQLAGLYAKEELDQADKTTGGYVVTAPGASDQPTSLPSAPPAPSALTPSVPNGGDSGRLTIVSVETRPTKNANVTKYIVVLSDGREVTTIKSQLGDLANQLCQHGDVIDVETKDTKWGTDLVALRRVLPEIDIHADMPESDHGMPVSADEIPFAWLLTLLSLGSLWA